MIERSTTITIEVLKILKDNGVNINNILKNGIDKKSFLLKDVKQAGIDISDIIKANNLNPYFKIEVKMNTLLDAYNGDKKVTLTEQERKWVEFLDISTEKKTKATEAFEILEILKQNGIDLNIVKEMVKENKRFRSTLLKEITQQRIDIIKIMEENCLNPDLKIDYIFKNLDKSQEERLGITAEKNTYRRKKKNDSVKTWELLEILRQNGIDVSKIKMFVKKDGKRKGILLKEIEQPGIDIMKIIEDYGLNPEENIGIQMARMNESPLTLKQRLQEKANEPQILKDTTTHTVEKEIHNNIKAKEEFNER